MESHVSVFGTAGIVSSVWIDRESIDGPEMALDGSEFLLVDQPKKARLELSHLSGGRRHGHGLLTTAQQDVVLGLADDRVVDGSIGGVGPEVLEVDGVVELGGEIGRGGQKERLLAVHLQAVDLLVVGPEFVLDVPRYRIEETDHAVVKGDQQVLVEVRPPDVGHLHALAVFLGHVDFQDGCDGVARAVAVGVVAVKDADLGVVLHEGIRDGGKELVVVAPGHPADGPPVDKGLQEVSRFAAPHLDGGVGAGGQQVPGKAVRVQVPDGSLVAVKGSQALPVFDPPHAGDLILAGAEQQVPVVVVLDDRDGAFVSLQQIRAHFTSGLVIGIGCGIYCAVLCCW
mmetsp:Transcript_13794/g.28966  ORF Transcript_13794/g.28966 Transcript_13794/m.28966 type:complete len:342 (-) Transcript_13794:148-1173(-)